MKKSSILVIIVAFIVSIFMVNFYGLSVRTEHMENYIHSIEITHCTLVATNQRVDYQVQGKGTNQRKTMRVDFSQQEGAIGLYIEYQINPDNTPSDEFEFEIVDGNQHVTEIIDEQEYEYDYASIVRNKLTLNHICTIKVVMRTTDGSGLYDSLTIICRDYQGKLNN